MEPVAPKEDWNIDASQLQLGDCIGAGSFGQVFKAKYLGIEVAVKKILQSVEQAQEFEHEVAVLKYVEGQKVTCKADRWQNLMSAKSRSRKSPSEHV